MPSDAKSPRQQLLLGGLTLLTFFFLLGTRALNEPDEGRYAEIAREMIETGNWLVPQFWYEPHLNKPPLTCWLVAASMSLFGFTEWAVRLPLALAGLSGVWATWLLAKSLGGRRVGWWSALVLQTSLLYFVMARMLTTDIFLTQFITWAIYFFWRGWRALDALNHAEADRRGRAARLSFAWQVAAWAALAGGFLAKGPGALAIPLAAMAGLALFRRRESTRWPLLLLGALAGFMVFALLAAPWFWQVFHTVPGAFDHMVKGQAVGHVLGTTIKNRSGPPYYFAGVLLLGFLPWTLLLGWLWRRTHWRALSETGKDGWVLLSVWVGFTFVLFSLTRAKLPAYILPLFPPLAVLVVLRWLGNDEAPETVPGWVWRGVLASPLVLMAAIPLVVRFAVQVTGLPWVWPQCLVALAGAVALWRASKKWPARRCLNTTVALALLNLFLGVALVPSFENSLGSNQTLKSFGAVLRRERQPGDLVVCWGTLPQGLIFYTFPAINATNRPYLAGISPRSVPFEFPGNRDRFGTLILEDVTALANLLARSNRVLLINREMDPRLAAMWVQNLHLHTVAQVGDWLMYSSR